MNASGGRDEVQGALEQARGPRQAEPADREQRLAADVVELDGRADDLEQTGQYRHLHAAGLREADVVDDVLATTP